MKASDIMQKELITVKPDMKVREVAYLLREHELSALPVVDDEGKVIGIISENDLIYRLARPHLPPHIELLGGVIYLENPFEMRNEIEKMTAVNASEIMTRKVIAATPDTDVEEIANVMIEKNINGVPIVDGAKLIGIITRHDLLAALAYNPRNNGGPQ